MSMRPLHRFCLVLVALLAVASCGSSAAAQAAAPSGQLSSHLRLIAPGVWFRTGAPLLVGNGVDITENTMIVEMKDYLVVIDSGTQNTARNTIADCHALSTKPVRYVFLTHHHFDHVGGNALWTAAGATTMAFPGVAEEMRRVKSEYELPRKTLAGDLFVLNDGNRRLEFHSYGWGHTRGDGIAFLPKEKILFCGDLAVNGPYNSFFDANLRNWPAVLRQLEALQPTWVLPGHGAPASAELLRGQRAFLEQFIAQVQQAIAQGKKLDDLIEKKDGKAVGIRLTFPPELARWSANPFSVQLVESAYSQLSQPPQTVETLDPALCGRIDRIADQVLEQTGVPSASVAVVQHGKLVYTHAYGQARLATETAPAVAATPQMRYSIGSISKQFTAAAILLLQEDGKLKLDDAVGKYVPNLTRGNEVTIRQILSHTSGYQDYWPEDYVMTTMLPNVSAQQILDTWAKKPLDFEPGTQWQYSNTNFVIAGRIVERVVGEPLMDFLTQRVFRPLGMTSVWNSDETKLTQADAAAYYRHALGPLRVAPKEGRGWMFAAGELAMTARDLALWDESLIAQSLLKPASYTQMFTEVKLENGMGTHYGLGVQVIDRDDHRSIEHSGEVSGFVSDNEVLVDDGAAVAVLTNQDAVGAASAIAHLAAPVVAGYQQNDAEKQAIAIFHGLQQGRIDRSQLAPNLSDYFTAEALADFQSSLAPLGEPLSFRQTARELRGGMTFRGFEIVYPGKRLSLTTYTYPNGKLEQYLIAPAE